MKYVTIPKDIQPMDNEGRKVFQVDGDGKKHVTPKWVFTVWLLQRLADNMLIKTGTDLRFNGDLATKVKAHKGPILALSDPEHEHVMRAIETPTGGYSNTEIHFQGASIMEAPARQMRAFFDAMYDAKPTRPKPPANKNKAKRARKTK